MAALCGRLGAFGTAGMMAFGFVVYFVLFAMNAFHLFEERKKMNTNNLLMKVVLKPLSELL